MLGLRQLTPSLTVGVRRTYIYIDDALEAHQVILVKPDVSLTKAVSSHAQHSRIPPVAWRRHA